MTKPIGCVYVEIGEDGQVVVKPLLLNRSEGGVMIKALQQVIRYLEVLTDPPIKVEPAIRDG